MTDSPLKIPRYIQLIVSEPLDKSQATAWMTAVRRGAPSGTVATVQTTNAQGTLTSVCMVHQESGDKHAYRVPLTRDLAADEVQKIVDGFSAAEPDLDFDIETSNIVIQPEERAGISLSDERHIAICTAMAKARHENWLRDRLGSGWRYGIEFDVDEKTHPLLRPWDQLPDQFRQPDMSSPQALLDLISAEGYAIVPKTELELAQKRKI